MAVDRLMRDIRGDGGAGEPAPESDRFAAVVRLLWHPEVEARRKAIEAILAKPSARYAEPLAWKLGDDQSEIRDLAEMALEALGRDALPFIRRQMYCPLPDIRERCTHLLGRMGALADLLTIVVALYDYEVDNREAGRRALRRIAERYTAQWNSGALKPDPASLAKVAGRLFQLLATLDSTSSVSLSQAIVGFGRHIGPILWQAYPEIPEKSRAALESELLRKPEIANFEILYEGLLHEDDYVRRRVMSLLTRLIHRTTINLHMEVLASRGEAERRSIAAALHAARVLEEFCELVLWMDAEERRLLVEMVCGVAPLAHERFLIQALRLDDPAIIRRILGVFRDHPDRDFREPLITVLGNRDEGVVVETIEYFSGVGGASSVNYLIPLLSDERPAVSRAAVAAISRLTRARLMDSFDELGEGERTKLLLILHKLDAGFLQDLRNTLDIMEDEEKIRFARVLGAIGAIEDVTEDLKQLLSDPSPRVRATLARAIHVLTEVHERQAVCQRLLQDADARVRANAIESLPDNLSPDLLAQLRQATHSEDNRERANALKRLMELGHTHYAIELESMLEHADPWFRTSALWVVGQLGIAHLAGVVMGASADPSPQVRQHSALALARIGSTEQVRALGPLLNDPDPQVREAVRTAFRAKLGLDYE